MFRKSLDLVRHSLNEEYYESLSRLPSIESESADQGTDDSKPSGSGREEDPVALHRAAFYNDVPSLRRLLAGRPLHKLLALDSHGTTALHVAVLRHSLEAITLLLDAGLPPVTKNTRRWTPLDEAVALRDKEAARLLLIKVKADAKAEMKQKKMQLVATLRQLADFKMKLRWELGSPLFGLLLRRYAPDDTYQMYKAGTMLRIDGSLMGLDTDSHSLLPRWKRGHFSVLVNAGVTPVVSQFVDHEKRTYVDLYKTRKSRQKDAALEVEELFQEGAGKVRMKSSEFDFVPVKTWLGRDATERLEGWQTEIYEATGKLVATTLLKSTIAVPEGASFEEYQQMELPEDEVEEIPLDPLSPPTKNSIVQGASGSSSSGGKKPKPRRISGRAWMARDFPISLQQLLPLLEVVGSGNKHFAKAASFIRRMGASTNSFPVKAQIPLIWTVYLMLSFRAFELMGSADPARAPGFFEVPAGYREVRLEDLGDSKASSLLDGLHSGQVPLI